MPRLRLCLVLDAGFDCAGYGLGVPVTHPIPDEVGATKAARRYAPDSNGSITPFWGDSRKVFPATTQEDLNLKPWKG